MSFEQQEHLRELAERLSLVEHRLRQIQHQDLLCRVEGAEKRLANLREK